MDLHYTLHSPEAYTYSQQQQDCNVCNFFKFIMIWLYNKPPLLHVSHMLRKYFSIFTLTQHNTKNWKYSEARECDTFDCIELERHQRLETMVALYIPTHALLKCYTWKQFSLEN